MPEATTYLTIYFSGMLGLMLYNMGSGVLRAVGDSKRPFYFLVIMWNPMTNSRSRAMFSRAQITRK